MRSLNVGMGSWNVEMLGVNCGEPEVGTREVRSLWVAHRSEPVYVNYAVK